jgi:zinc transport system ATP-binding protein
VATQSAPPGPSLIALEGVSYHYGEDLALEGIDLELAAGERLAVLGPNGGGKTTLLRLLLGLSRPSAGRVRCPRGAARPRCGYVPQFPDFDRHFPVRLREMVLEGTLRDRRLLRPADRRTRLAVEELLAQLALTELADAYLGELSGGELKRALLARALVGRPELLVLDEPSASLDEASRRVLWRLVGELPAATAVVLATHDLAPDTFAATRALLVDRRLEPLGLDGLHAHPLVCGHGHG